MLRNYIKIAFRNLRKNPGYTFINITGLAVGLAAGVLVLLWVADEFRYDRFHEKLPRLCVMLQHQTMQGETFTFQAMPGPLAAALPAEIPEVKHAARMTWTGQYLFRVGDKSGYEKGIFVEPSFFQIFTFPALKGDPEAALRDAGSCVLTEQAARKYFGDADPVGQIIRYNNEHDLKVGAVIKDVPEASSIRFDVLLPFRRYALANPGQIDSWNTNSFPTWIELQPGAQLESLNTKLHHYIQGKHAGAAAHLQAYPFAKWRLESEFSNGQPSGGRMDLVLLFLATGVFILLIACVNFMNLSTARSAQRAREVGVRKVVGAQRRLIVGQFLCEALVLTFMGLALALVLVALLLPLFNRLAEKHLALEWADWRLWSGLAAGTLATGLLAGSYPAFFLSGFQPVRVLKGLTGQGRKGALLRKGLVGFQFVISIFLIIGTLAINRQVQYVQNRPLGFAADNLIDIPARGDMGGNFTAFKNEMLRIPAVKSVSNGRDNLVNYGSNSSGFSWPGYTDEQDFLMTLAWVGPDFVSTTGMRIKEGRDLYPEFGGDTLSILLNEAAVQRMGLQNPVGTVIQYDTARTVVGVVEDFVFNNPFGRPEPLAIMLDREAYSHFYVRFDNDADWKANLARIEQVYKQHFPAYPFEFRFTREEFQRQFQRLSQVGMLANIFGALAIFISCLGLLGLSAYMAEQRRKEIGIRKVLGARLSQIWLALSKDFLKPVLAAFVLAVPLGAWAMSKFLTRFDYRIELGWPLFAMAGGAAFLVALLTVSVQGIRAALADPVRSLRSE